MTIEKIEAVLVVIAIIFFLTLIVGATIRGS